jgi:hypothetical protein
MRLPHSGSRYISEFPLANIHCLPRSCGVVLDYAARLTQMLEISALRLGTRAGYSCPLLSMGRPHRLRGLSKEAACALGIR